MERRFVEWGIRPRGWWQLWISRTRFPADEYGPSEEIITFGPFQFRYELWKDDR